MVAPFVFNLIILFNILFLLCGSTATVGSSKNMSFGLWAIPHAILSLRSKPPDNSFG